MKPTGSQLSSLPCQSQPSTAPSRHLYLSQFPGFLHPHIDDIVDVGDNENCDFRAIADLLGRGEESWLLVKTQLDN
jgi:hypothetical protein